MLLKNWVLVFSFMYLVSVDPMDRSLISFQFILWFLFFNFRYTPRYLYPEIKYPLYCYGPMYILSVPAIRTLTKLFEQDFQHFLWLEDVYLTGKYKFITMQTGN